MKNRIKELRARKNITQLELAKLVGVRRETIVFLEKGKYNPSLKLAFDISNFFNLQIEEVFSLTSPTTYHKFSNF
ncbi:MAG: helix-turn-helix transcriptional regulator [Flavobacteriales bacterium]|nr:helix-turn-helix transcriptional regulator [Flavobacteriales bacterium]